MASTTCLVFSGIFFWLYTRFADRTVVGIAGSIYGVSVGVLALRAEELRDYSLAFVGIGISLERCLYLTLIVLVGGLLAAIAQRYRLF